MNIYSCYTPSHRRICWKYFEETICYDISLVSFLLPKIGDGNYKNVNWTEATKHKILSILKIIDLGIDDIFIFSDVDVQFFGPITDLITESIKEYDIVTQHDPSMRYDHMYCTGFMAIRPSEKIRNLFQSTLDLMEEKPRLDDQDAFNVVIRETNNDVNIGLFDQNKVWSHRKMWEPGTPLEIPEDILVHHANWTVNVQNKEAQLEEVSKIYEEKHGVGYLYNRASKFRDRDIFND